MRIWILAIATVAVLIGVAGGAYWYGGNGANESALVLNRAPAASDGIKVHGDWTLTVSNPDGSVDSVHEFENKLVEWGGGNAMLALLLEGKGIVKEEDGANRWKLGFYTSDLVYYESTVAETSFEYLEEHSGIADWNKMKSFQIMGTLIVPLEWNNIGKVRTSPGFKPSLIPSLNWDETAGQYTGLTVKEFDNPIPVQPGQLVSTTVRISFE